MKRICTFFVLLTLCAAARAQYPVLIHSHNDYAQLSPFWLAYSQRARTVAWEKLISLGLDYINTDKLAECAMFLSDRK